MEENTNNKALSLDDLNEVSGGKASYKTVWCRSCQQKANIKFYASGKRDNCPNCNSSNLSVWDEMAWYEKLFK